MNEDVLRTLLEAEAYASKEKEREADRLMFDIGNGKQYTVSEYRPIESRLRKLVGLPQRDYGAFV